MSNSRFSRMEEEFEQYDRGEARLNAIRDAMREADQEKDLQWQFWFRYDYLEESIFCGDRYYALIIFPELMQLFDANPVLQEDGRCSHSLLIAFKWIVEAAPEFPQISREQIDGYFREFKKRLRREGKSLSIYYMKRSLFYMHVDMDVASMCFYRFLEEPLDDISDGRALFHDQQVIYYLAVNEYEKAMQAAKPIFDGKLRSNSLPQATYLDFVKYYMLHDRIDDALRCAKLILPRVNGDPYYHDAIGTLMTLYSVYDLPQAVSLFQRNYPDYLESKNPWLRVLFAIGASHLFDALEHSPEHKAKLRLPQNADPTETAAQIRKTARELAEKFDARNGTNDFMNMLQTPFGKE